MEIVPLTDHTEHLATVVDWIANQWGGTRESIEACLADLPGRPPALLAIEDGAPTGIVGFNYHDMQPRGTTELWINVLYVAPPFRRQGVGTRLVTEATSAVADTNRKSLFVYSDIPGFYEAIGWQRFSHYPETGMHVLEYRYGLP